MKWRSLWRRGLAVWGDSRIQRHARNALFSGVAQVVAPLLMLIAMPIYLKALGVDIFGIWMLINGVVGFGNLLNFGLTEATIKYISKYRTLGDSESIVRIIRSSFTLYLTLATIGSLIIIVWAEPIAEVLLKHDESYLKLTIIVLRIASVGFIVRFISSIIDSIFYGFEKYDWVSQINILSDMLVISGNIVIALFTPDLRLVIGLTIAVNCISAICKTVIIRRHLISSVIWSPTLDITTLREIAGYGIYSWLHSAIGIMGANVDRILIARYDGLASVGHYTISLQLTRQIHSLLARIFAFLFPHLSSLYEQRDWPRLLVTFNYSTLALAMLGCVFVSPIYAFVKPLTTLWLGYEEADKVIPIISILCIRYLLLPTDIANYYLMLGTGMVRSQAVIGTLTASTVTLGMFIMTPTWGATGTAWAMLWSLPFLLFTRFYALRQLFQISELWRQFVILLIPIIGFMPALYLRLVSEAWIVNWLQLSGLMSIAAILAGIFALGAILVFHQLRCLPSQS